MESPRVWEFENRLKLLSIVTVIYVFLIDLLEPPYQELINKKFYVSNIIEPESDAEKLQHRFTVYAGRSAVCGTTFTRLSGAFFLPICQQFTL
jgi:hypothetical protein